MKSEERQDVRLPSRINIYEPVEVVSGFIDTMVHF